MSGAADDTHRPGGTTDTAGVPWHGRTLTPQPFAGDTGAADPALAAALAGHAAGTVPARDVVAALATARLLVPVVAVLGDEHPTPAGLRADLGADMAIVTVTGPDGVRGLPVFSATATLAAWDADARPVPVEAARAALSAVAEGCERLLLDPAGPHPFTVRRPALWAVGQGRPWLPSPDDPQVAAAVARAAATVDGVVGTRCEPGESAELRVVLGVGRGLDRAGLEAVVAAVGRALAAEQDVADRVDSMELRVLPA